MARYWVGGTGSWDNTAASKWATTSGGAGGAAVPTAADDVFLDAASGTVTVTVNTVTGNCQNLNCTGFTGTLTLTTSLNTAPTAGGTVLISSGMTINGAATLGIASASGANATLTTNGKTLPSVNFASSTAGGVICADAFTSSGTITLTTGTLNTNNQTCIWGLFSSSNSNTRTLTLGSSTIALTGAFTASPGTNLTVSTNTAVVTMSGAGPNVTCGANVGSTLGGISFVLSGSGGAIWSCGLGGIKDVSRIGTAVKTDSLTLNASSLTCTGTFTATGNSVTNRLLILAAPVGTARTLTAATVSLTNVDFTDVTAGGAAAPFTGTSLGDGLGNSGITFTTPATQTRTGAGGNWSTAGNWTSRVPLPQDNVIVASGASGAISVDMPRLGKSLDFTGFAGTVTVANAISLYGNITLTSGMTYVGAGFITTFGGRGAQTITSAGKTLGAVQLVAPGGSYSLMDALTSTSLASYYGDFTTNNNTITTAIFTNNTVAATRTYSFGSSTFNLTAAGSVWNWFPTNNTISPNTATINITDASATAKTFGGNGGNYSGMTLNYMVATVPSQLIITGASTFGNLNIGSGRILSMPASTVNTIGSGGSFNVNGANNSYQYFPGVTSNYASAPTSAPLQFTGDLEVIAALAPDTWTPASLNQTIASIYSGTAATTMWMLELRTTGVLSIYWSDGTTIRSTVGATVVPTNSTWVRMTRVASTGVTTYYSSTDPRTTSPGSVSWTQIGSSVAGVAGTMTSGVTTALNIGAFSSGTGPFSGKLYKLRINNGIGGTVAFDANFTAKAFGANTFTESSSNAATVTINGPLAQAGDGRVSLVSSTPGTPATISKVSGTTSVDYLTIQDSAATGGATWYAGANSVNVSGNSGWFFRVPFAGGSFFHVM